MNLKNDELKMNSKEIFQNNLVLLRQQKISYVDALSGVSGLRALSIIFNQSVLENGDNSMLANGHYCVELSLKDIYEQMSKRVQKKYYQYEQGISSVNTRLLRRDIRMLIVSGVIRKVSFKELPSYGQVDIINEEKGFKEGWATNNPYINTSYYEILDLRRSHLERLAKLKYQEDLSYDIVKQLFGAEIANDCFNTTVKNYRNGLNTFDNDSFKQIIETIQKNRVVPVKELSEYCSHKFSLMNGVYKSQQWWFKQLKGFDFSQYNIKLCKNSKLSQEDKLSLHGNSLVLITL